jgi:hypothetical protein
MKSLRTRRFMLSIFALSAMPGSALLAQNITGTWQGTLKVNSPNGSVDLRTVMKISRADDESLKGVFYSIDQGAAPMNRQQHHAQGLGGQSLHRAVEWNIRGDA